jgi:hypothetical protein
MGHDASSGHEHDIRSHPVRATEPSLAHHLLSFICLRATPARMDEARLQQRRLVVVVIS